MSISNAMASGVSGLLANSTAVERISYNIANANTVGYRRSFAQMVTAGALSASGGSLATGVKTNLLHTNHHDGSYQATQRATNLAISGTGFFVVNQNVDALSSSPNVFSRVGSFEPDNEGFLRNAAGHYLMGFGYDDTGSLGAVDRSSFNDLIPVNVANQTISGTTTSTMAITGNLPSQETGQTNPGDPFVSSVEYYTPLGDAERLTFSWAPSSTANQWVLTVSDGTSDFGTVTIDYNDSGALAGSPQGYSAIASSPVAPATFAFDPLTGQMTIDIDNGTIPQNVVIDLGAPDTFDGLTQFAGDYTPLKADVDGSQSGTLVRVEFDEFGEVWGIFDNGTRKPLYSIPLATVPNQNGLLTTDNSTFSVSMDSGAFYLGAAGSGEAGTINAGGLESSNVDIADELTSLIQRQRAYSSNAKIITTADDMLDEMIRMKR